MILTKLTEAEAQELADRCHVWLINNDPAYAASVADGHTLRWALPTYSKDAGLWSVQVNERVYGCLTKAEYDPPVADPL